MALEFNEAQRALIRERELEANGSHPEVESWIADGIAAGPQNYAGGDDRELVALADPEDRDEFARALGYEDSTLQRMVVGYADDGTPKYSDVR